MIGRMASPSPTVLARLRMSLMSKLGMSLPPSVEERLQGQVGQGTSGTLVGPEMSGGSDAALAARDAYRAGLAVDDSIVAAGAASAHR